ncbi:hypothetical protein DTO166G4_4891 [Paecilomyces variotii]|nr:hypothetical protein DTO166G4_4891 [Paecilomyces variotii]KAJ9233568.1 hypothetical protein DTO166G5_5691 [Paecilomyces variotii]
MSQPPPETTPEDTSSFLHRSASYNHLPDVQVDQESTDMKRTFSDVNLAALKDSPSKESVETEKAILRRASQRTANGRPKIAVSQFTLSAEELKGATGVNIEDAATDPVPETKPPEPVVRPSRVRSMSGRLATLARKSWISTSSSSRSPSPTKDTKLKGMPLNEPSPVRQQDPSSLKAPPVPEIREDIISKPPPAEPGRRRSVLRRGRRPLSALVSRSKNDTLTIRPIPSSTSLRSKTSFDRLASSVNISTPVLPPVPKAPALAPTAGMDPPRKKDELWGVFRGLEGDYQKFQSKSSSLKANVLRSSLLPFLHRYSNHASCKTLRPEDLDRRVNILNKWWTGLLEMLNGRNNQSISGTDRPVYLEAVAGIMTRPEWRIAFAVSQSWPPVSQRSSTASSDCSRGSTGSDFLVESIHHNIRNIFTQNLLSQMAFVVERMSMRHAPASLVSFCGKACAYAFFFCPGIADILVRLWNTPPDVLRRVLAESAVYRGLDTRTVAGDLALCFPPAIRALSFSGHAAMIRYLRQKPNVPLSASRIPWNGPWMSRWSGRDTDLFFVFVKYFHVLFSEFVPANLEKDKRILAPGLLSVHGQLLVVLEDTLYKQSIPQMPENPHAVASVTFDDFMEGPDASASAMPLGVANCHRSMAENRLIILLRDLLSESSAEPCAARQLYAESFCSIMKAAARKVSRFDHNACFVLCDFLEEVGSIFVRFSQFIQTELFDWDFWLDVCRQMMKSHNSLTEVRVFSFFFCIWNTLTSCEERKGDLCHGILLNENYFYHYFNHWSPMVRSYFHRLICWRVARYNGDRSPMDSSIYEALADRLEQIWAYYLTFQSRAEKELSAPLSSAPCSPAPGRRIIIIRSDNLPSPPSLFVSFDRVVPPPSSVQPTAYRNHSSLKLHTNEPPAEPAPAPKKRWSILRTMFGSPANPKPGEVTPPGSACDELESHTADEGSSVPGSKRDSEDKSQPQAAPAIRRPRTPHQQFCFRFSLEWLDRPQWPSKNKRLFPPRLPVATQLHLQGCRSMSRHTSTDSVSDLDSDSESRSARASGSETGSDDRSARQDHQHLGRQQVKGPERPTKEELLRPRNETLVASKYAGRALAEWAQVVSECDSFFERRRDEGVPCDRLVETPILGVESFRK